MKYPGFFVPVYSLIVPLCYLCVLIEYLFLFIWCFFFQTFKLFILPKLNYAHIPFSKANQPERININLNFGILLEGLAFSFPQIILLSIHKWINSSDDSVILLTIYILFIFFALLTLIHSIINFVFNIKFDQTACGMKIEPYILRLFPLREGDPQENTNYCYQVQGERLFEKIRRDIPKIEELAYIPEYAHTQNPHKYNHLDYIDFFQNEELKEEEIVVSEKSNEDQDDEGTINPVSQLITIKDEEAESNGKYYIPYSSKQLLADDTDLEVPSERI